MKNFKINKNLFAIIAITSTLTLAGSVYAEENNNMTAKQVVTTESSEEQKELVEIPPVEIIAKEDINIRRESNNDSEIIATIESGTKLQSIEKDNNWYKIIYNDEIGYIKAEYVYESIDKSGKKFEKEIITIDDLEIERTTYVKATTDVNIRKDATAESEIIGGLSKGEKLKAIKLLDNGWYKVKYNGKKAYINGKYLKETTKDKIISPFKKIVKFDHKSKIYSDADKSKEFDEVKSYEIAYVYKEFDNTYLSKVNDNIVYVNKDDTSKVANKVVIVDISDQNAKLYDGNDIIVDTPVVTGNASTTPSDIGYFDIDYKQRNTYLEGPGYKSFVDYWMPYNEGEGLHDAEHHDDNGTHTHYDPDGKLIEHHGWRYYENFGGTTYKDAGSHGCVNLPNEAAKKIYKNVEEGTKVLVKE